MAGPADNAVAPPVTRPHRVLSRRCRLITVFIALVSSFIGSAAIILVADYSLFRYGTWSGWTLTQTRPSRHELEWWKSHVDPRPPRTSNVSFVYPAIVTGRDGRQSTYDMSANGGRLLGLESYRISTRSPFVRGSVLASPSLHVWRLGVQFPGGTAVERQIRTNPGQAPPHPTNRGWKRRIRPMEFALNTLYGAVLLCIVITLIGWPLVASFHRIRGLIRLAYGRCPECGHALLPEQEACPACGTPRPKTAAGTS